MKKFKWLIISIIIVVAVILATVITVSALNSAKAKEIESTLYGKIYKTEPYNFAGGEMVEVYRFLKNGKYGHIYVSYETTAEEGIIDYLSYDYASESESENMGTDYSIHISLFGKPYIKQGAGKHDIEVNDNNEVVSINNTQWSEVKDKSFGEIYEEYNQIYQSGKEKTDEQSSTSVEHRLVGSWTFDYALRSDTNDEFTPVKPYISNINFKNDGTGLLNIRTEQEPYFEINDITWVYGFNEDGVMGYEVELNGSKLGVYYISSSDSVGIANDQGFFYYKRAVS